MTAGTFTPRWLAAIVVLFVFAFIFPTLLAPMVSATGCRGIPGACGAVAVIFGTYARFAVIIGVGAYLAHLVWKRSRSIGAKPHWVILFLIPVYLASAPSIPAFRYLWEASYRVDAVSLSKPLSALVVLLSILIALSSLPDKVAAWRGAFRWIMLISGCAIIILTFDQWMKGLTGLPFVGYLISLDWTLFVMSAAMVFHSIVSICLIVATALFVVTLISWVIVSRRPDVGIADENL